MLSSVLPAPRPRDDEATAPSRPTGSTTRPARIVHVSDFFLPRLGGIERHVSDLAAAQRSAGHQVDVVSVGGCVDDGTPAHRPPSRPLPARSSWSRNAIRVAREAVLDGGYDVVHVHASLGTPLAFAVASAASEAGLPTVVTMHSMLGRTGSLFRAIDPVVGWRRWPVEWTAVSRTAADDLARRLPDDRTVSVLHNAIDVQRWRGDQPEQHDGVHVVAVMRLARRKRPLPLLRMLDAVRASAPRDVPIRATIVGDGPSRLEMERYLAQRDLGSWIELVGRRDHDEIRALYRTADLFVAPAIQESFGIAALEARAAGLPVVARTQSGIAEFIDHGSSGLLASTDRAMADAITRLTVDAPLRDEIAAHNAEVPPPFGWDGAVREAEQAYHAAAWHQIVRSTAPARRSPQQVRFA